MQDVLIKRSTMQCSEARGYVFSHEEMAQILIKAIEAEGGDLTGYTFVGLYPARAGCRVLFHKLNPPSLPEGTHVKKLG